MANLLPPAGSCLSVPYKPLCAKAGAAIWHGSTNRQQGGPKHFLTAPVTYGLALPFAFLDLCVTPYQAICFPVYRVAEECRRPLEEESSR
jgi:hypothetical protein